MLLHKFGARIHDLIHQEHVKLLPKKKRKGKELWKATGTSNGLFLASHIAFREIMKLRITDCPITPPTINKGIL